MIDPRNMSKQEMQDHLDSLDDPIGQLDDWFDEYGPYDDDDWATFRECYE